MRETRMAVVVSEEQGEVAKFNKWDLDIIPYRKLMKEGIDLPESMRAKPEYRNMQTMALDDAFKAEEHPLRVAIVCAMWLTGFDVPTLSTLYLDKPLKAHTLMQAIARANRRGRRKEQRPDRGLLRHPQAPAPGAGDVCRGAAGRRRRRDRPGPAR
jgi:type I restriction enzyme R subunit